MIVLMYGVIMLSGILIGAKCHWIPKESKIRADIQYLFLFTLLFVLGHQLGSDDEVVASITSMGFYGAVLSVSGMTGSFLLVLLIRKLIEAKKEAAKDD